MSGLLDIGIRISRDGVAEALPFALLGLLCFWAILKLRRSGSRDEDGERDEVTVVLDRDDAEALSDHGRAREAEVKKLYSDGAAIPEQAMESDVQLIGWNTEESETKAHLDTFNKILFFDSLSDEDQKKVMSFMNQYKWMRAEEVTRMSLNYNEKLLAQKNRKKAVKAKDEGDEGRLFGDGSGKEDPAGGGAEAEGQVSSAGEGAMIDSGPETFDFGGMDDEREEDRSYGDAEEDNEDV